MDEFRQRGSGSFRRPNERPAFRRTSATNPVRRAPTDKKPPQKNQKDVNISISLSIPAGLPAAFKRSKKAVKSITLPRPSAVAGNRYVRLAAAGSLALAVLFGLWQVFGPSVTPPNEQATVQGAETTAPQFQPAVPENKKQVERKYYPDRKSFAYKDQIGGIEVVVSQQQLPEAFKADPQGSVEAFAKKSSFDTPIEADGVTAYAGKDVSGSQTVVFQKEGLLIFIYATKELETANIASYIKILEN